MSKYVGRRHRTTDSLSSVLFPDDSDDEYFFNDSASSFEMKTNEDADDNSALHTPTKIKVVSSISSERLPLLSSKYDDLGENQDNDDEDERSALLQDTPPPKTSSILDLLSKTAIQTTKTFLIPNIDQDEKYEDEEDHDDDNDVTTKPLLIPQQRLAAIAEEAEIMQLDAPVRFHCPFYLY